MANENFVEGSSMSGVTDEGSGSTVELSIKTLDSQIYTFHVNKNMPVLLFKEKIANEIGVPVGQQRLIFRGKVLKDDHLLSEYHVEDGSTLHLVARQPAQSQPLPGTNSGETNQNDARGTDGNAGATRNRVGQISHSVVLGTFNIGDQGEGIVPDLTRIIGAVLNSIGIGNQTLGGTTNIPSSTPSNGSSSSQGTEAEGTHGNVDGNGQAGGQAQRGQAFPNHPFQSLPQSLQFPLAGVAVPIPSLHMPIPDSLSTISEFINHMEQALPLNGYQPNPSTNVGDTTRVELPFNERGLPTPEALSIIIRRAQQLLSAHAVAALSHITRRLEEERTSTDPSVRGQIQAESVQVGLAMQHLGALLLELGRTILTLRMGQTPAESVVNAGPAVYISPSGPNPIMVQPFPLQTSSLFSGASATSRANPGNMGPFGLGDVPRNINIHIHAGTSLASGALSVGSRANAGESTHDGSGSGDSGPARVVPVRNVIAAAVPRSSAETANVLSVIYPFHGRSQQINPNHSAPIQGSSTSSPNSRQSDASGENQDPSGQSSTPIIHDSSVGSGVDSNLENHQPESMAIKGAGGTALSGPKQNSAGEGIQTHHKHRQFNNNEDTIDNSSSREASSSNSGDGSAVASENVPRSSQSYDPPEGSNAVPLGLGLGGLQPKRRSRQMRPQGRDNSGISHAIPVNENQSTIAGGQRVLQSLLSQSTNANRIGANGPSVQLPSVLGQIMESLPLQRQGSSGQVDAAGAMSQVLNSPALNGLLAGVSEQAGIGSPAVLRNMLAQFTQSPTMRNTLNQIAQQVESQDIGNMFSGLGSGQGGGVDLSTMIQQMMPIVSQALTRGSTQHDTFCSSEPESQQQHSQSRPGREDKPDYQTSQVGIQQTVNRIEHHDPPSGIFRSMVENATLLYSDGNGSEDLEELYSDDSLANEYIQMLRRDICSRLQGDSGPTDKS
ncbi:PREDICTED: large proline-rich protein bag6-B [Nelumbo nucifera]|uniref:Large proline-rich protein bag6-B n=1 Tax=Nelumbo nucifera TaxID=4432 RepID=A0A1U8AG83_NELNU|nr:PREDICTED: large proline-rich protein bag6-B [Nelumbo nucifera]XP_010266101.1 PREDICTED: large proline-rich protein bag6-B [Nelumbo nucifera]